MRREGDTWSRPGRAAPACVVLDRDELCEHECKTAMRVPSRSLTAATTYTVVKEARRSREAVIVGAAQSPGQC